MMVHEGNIGMHDVTYVPLQPPPYLPPIHRHFVLVMRRLLLFALNSLVEPSLKMTTVLELASLATEMITYRFFKEKKPYPNFRVSEVQLLLQLRVPHSIFIKVTLNFVIPAHGKTGQNPPLTSPNFRLGSPVVKGDNLIAPQYLLVALFYS